jgi:hypothetical protein
MILEMKSHLKKLRIFGMSRRDFNTKVLRELEGIESLQELHLFHTFDMWMPEIKTRLKVTLW